MGFDCIIFLFLFRSCLYISFFGSMIFVCILVFLIRCGKYKGVYYYGGT